MVSCYGQRSGHKMRSLRPWWINKDSSSTTCEKPPDSIVSRHKICAVNECCATKKEAYSCFYVFFMQFLNAKQFCTLSTIIGKLSSLNLSGFTSLVFAFLEHSSLFKLFPTSFSTASYYLRIYLSCLAQCYANYHEIDCHSICVFSVFDFVNFAKLQHKNI